MVYVCIYIYICRDEECFTLMHAPDIMLLQNMLLSLAFVSHNIVGEHPPI